MKAEAAWGCAALVTLAAAGCGTSSTGETKSTDDASTPTDASPALLSYARAK